MYLRPCLEAIHLTNLTRTSWSQSWWHLFKIDWEGTQLQGLRQITTISMQQPRSLWANSGRRGLMAAIRTIVKASPKPSLSFKKMPSLINQRSFLRRTYSAPGMRVPKRKSIRKFSRRETSWCTNYPSKFRSESRSTFSWKKGNHRTLWSQDVRRSTSLVLRSKVTSQPLLFSRRGLLRWVLKENRMRDSIKRHTMR